MTPMKIVVTGAEGNLGVELVRAFRAAGHDVSALGRSALDVTDRGAVRARIVSGGCDIVVNAAAWNDVDGAEEPAKRARVFALNAEAPHLLAQAARDAGAAFVHFSTDYVFDGSRPEGYLETDVPLPLSVYGESKAAGERAALSLGGRVYLVRTSRLFGRWGASAAPKPSFVSVMLMMAETLPELSIVDEEVGCPTYTRDLAEATVRLVTDGAHPPGIYHLVNDGPGATWYGFAEEFFGILGVTTPRKPVTVSAFPRPAERPRFAALLNTRFPPLRPRLEALKAFLADIRGT